MSGLEVPAFVAAVIGTAAGTVSAWDKFKRMGNMGGGRFHEETRTWDNGYIQMTEKKIVSTRGKGSSGVSANGDLYAWSSDGGRAWASSSHTIKNSNNSGKTKPKKVDVSKRLK